MRATRSSRVSPGRAIAVVLATAAMSLPVATGSLLAQDRGNPEWHWVVHPTLWFANVDGLVTMGDASLEVGDSTLVASFSGEFEVGKGRWRAIGAFYDTNLDGSGEIEGGPLPVGTAVSYDFQLTYAELFASVEVGSFDTNQALEFMGGLRYVRHRLDVGGGGGTLFVRESWVEPVVGARYYAEMGRTFWVTIDGNMGGFGIGSTIAWVLRGTLGVRVYGPVDLTLATRYYETQYENSDTGYVWDEGVGQGWHLGLRIKG
ncbi:MAG: hypothetical protein ACC682_06355 [Gemmatimonadota bacterium]